MNGSPLHTVLERLDGIRESGSGYLARCPAHEDRHQSLSVVEGDDGRVLLKCHAGCATRDVAAAMGLEMKDLFPQTEHSASRNHSPPAGLSVDRLARAKGLPRKFLRSLGVRHRGRRVQITYFLEDGTEAPRQRLRSTLSAGEGSYWTKGTSDLVPYGLWKLSEAQEAGRLVLVEGESDCWTLWHCGFPALGLPGAASTDLLRAEHLDGVEHVYVVQERDQGGRTFSSGIQERIRMLGFGGAVYLVPMQRAKDPNALFRKEKGSFKPVFEQMLRGAVLTSSFSPEAFERAVRGLNGEALEDRALDLVERCAAMETTEVARAEVLLERAGLTYRFRRNWRSAVGDAAKTLQERRAALEAQKEDERSLTVRLAEAILKTEHFAVDAGGKLYHFDGGVYRGAGKDVVRRLCKALLHEWDESDKWSSYRASEVIEYIRVDRPRLWERPPAGTVNLKNGLLRLKTGRLDPHTPDYLSPVQFPVRYDPEAACPAWEQFVTDTFPEDAAAAGVAWQLAAWLLTLDHTIQKALLLLGDGGNGKSVFLQALSAFIGRGNITSMSLHYLESNRFATSALYGTLANVCPDLPSSDLSGTSVFKALTGGDRIHAEYKHGETFAFDPICRLLFSANHPPHSNDNSEGFYRRWLVIPFSRTFTGERRRPRAELDAALAADRELSGVLNKALQVLPQVRARGITQTRSMRAALRDFREVTDPFAVWLSEHVVEAPSAHVSCTKLRKAFNQAAKASGWQVMNAQTFGRRIREEFPDITRGERTLNDKRTRCYIGIGLRENGSHPPDPPDNYLLHGKSNGKMCEGDHTQNGNDLIKDRQYPVDPVESVDGSAPKVQTAPFAAGEHVEPSGEGAPGVVAGCAPTGSGGWIVSLRDGRQLPASDLVRPA